MSKNLKKSFFQVFEHFKLIFHIAPQTNIF
jgi:hypothetical protein